jgi:arylsulfatase A-like enzyme
MTQRPNILLIVMDATRFDYLSAYGYPRATTPNLDRLAENGVLFDQAFASAPWTPPSHASLFTGTYPSKHRVDVNENLHLNEKNRTLGEILSDNGYRTFGVLPDVHLSSVRGFHKGFQEYIETWRIPYFHLEYDWMECLMRNVIWGRDKRTYYTSRVIQRWLKKNANTTDPFFVFVNFKTVHNSYQPPRSFKRKFEARYPNADMRKVKYYSKKGGYSYMARRLELTEEEFLVIKSWYSGAVAYLDFRIGQLIQYLKDIGEYENTLIIVTADHGENLGEHHLAYHLFCLYDTLLHVPLIMSCPALLPRGRRISELASLVDVLPTILELLELEGEGVNMQGTSLVPFNGGNYHDEIFAEFGRPHSMVQRLQSEFPGHDFSPFDRGLQCIRTKDYKLIAGSDGTEELYDLKADPAETRNRLDELPDVTTALRSRLSQWHPATDLPFKSEHVVEDEAVIKALRALGYF